MMAPFGTWHTWAGARGTHPGVAVASTGQLQLDCEVELEHAQNSQDTTIAIVLQGVLRMGLSLAHRSDDDKVRSSRAPGDVASPSCGTGLGTGHRPEPSFSMPSGRYGLATG